MSSRATALRPETISAIASKWIPIESQKGLKMFMDKSILSTTKGSARIEWIDWAKGWAILFVVIYHSLNSVHFANLFPEYQYFTEWLIFIVATFIMPVFFALSGFVYQEATSWPEYKKKMLKRIASLGLPYIVFSLTYVFMQNLSPGNVTGGVYSWFSLLLIFSHPISYLWYLYALVLIYLFSGWLDLCKIKVEVQFIISLVLFLIASSIIELPMFLHMLFTWTITFNLGRLMKKYRNLFQVKWFMAMLAIMLVSWVVQSQLGVGNWYDTNGLTNVNFFSKMSSIPVFFYILSNLKKNRLNDFFRKYGSDSLIIYLVHAPTVSVMRALLVKIGINNYLVMIISVILLSWLISIFACYLAKKIKAIEFIFYPLRYIHLPK